MVEVIRTRRLGESSMEASKRAGGGEQYAVFYAMAAVAIIAGLAISALLQQQAEDEAAIEQAMQAAQEEDAGNLSIASNGLPNPTASPLDIARQYNVNASLPATNLSAEQRDQVRVAEAYYDTRNPRVRINHKIVKPGDSVFDANEVLTVVAIQRSAVHIRFPDGNIYRFPTEDPSAMENHGTPNAVDRPTTPIARPDGAPDVPTPDAPPSEGDTTPDQ